jgi:hypothetical protein
MAGGDDGQVSPKRCLDLFIKMISAMVSPDEGVARGGIVYP